MTRISDELQDEATRTDCFLCRPNAALLSNVSEAGYTVAGLGPLADGYAVVATHDHIEGLAEANAQLRRQYSEYATSVAERLSTEFGECFLVEHGNMAVCGIAEEGRAHCFHPHFLLIPSAELSTSPFVDYFGHDGCKFQSLIDAVNYGADRGQYLLAGKITGPFHVFLPNGELPRQFARALVAEQLGASGRASWRDMPDLQWTANNAAALRRVLKGL